MYVKPGGGSSKSAAAGGVGDYSVVGDYVCADEVPGDGSGYAVTLDKIDGEASSYMPLPCVRT